MKINKNFRQRKQSKKRLAGFGIIGAMLTTIVAILIGAAGASAWQLKCDTATKKYTNNESTTAHVNGVNIAPGESKAVTFGAGDNVVHWDNSIDTVTIHADDCDSPPASTSTTTTTTTTTMPTSTTASTTTTTAPPKVPAGTFSHMCSSGFHDDEFFGTITSLGSGSLFARIKGGNTIVTFTKTGTFGLFVASLEGLNPGDKVTLELVQGNEEANTGTVVYTSPVFTVNNCNPVVTTTTPTTTPVTTPVTTTPTTTPVTTQPVPPVKPAPKPATPSCIAGYKQVNGKCIVIVTA